MRLVGKTLLIKTNFLLVTVLFIGVGMTIFIQNNIIFSLLNGALRFAIGLALQLQVSITAYVLTLFPTETPRFVFSLSIGFGLGASFCPALGALIYHFLGYQGPAYFVAVIQLLMGLTMNLVVRPEEEIRDNDEELI